MGKDDSGAICGTGDLEKKEKDNLNGNYHFVLIPSVGSNYMSLIQHFWGL